MKRFLLVLLALSFIFSVTSCTKKPTAPLQTQTTSAELTPPKEEPLNLLYQTLLQDYKSLLEFRLSDDFYEKYNSGLKADISNSLINAYSSDEELSYRWSCMFVELPAYGEPNSLDSYGYILYDMNNDGIDEMFWVRNDHSVFAVFTIYNGNLVFLDGYWSRYSAVVRNGGTLLTSGSGGAAWHTTTVCYLENGKLQEAYAFFTEDSDTGIKYFETTESGKRELTERQYQDISSRYTFSNSDFWLNMEIQHL